MTVNFQRTRGLLFQVGADGSTLKALSLVNASNAGVTLNASHVTLQGNYIGLAANGTTVAGNRGDGVRINASSQGDLIGQAIRSRMFLITIADSVGVQPVSGWQGIRAPSTPGQYLIAGTSVATDCSTSAPIPASTARATPSTTLAPHPPASTGPTSSAEASCGSSAATRPAPATSSTGFVFQGTTADLSNAGTTRRSTIPTRRTPTFTARWATSRSATPTDPATRPRHRTMRSSTTSRQSTFLADIVYPGPATSPRPTASGTTAARATRSAAAIPPPRAAPRRRPRAISSTTTRPPANSRTGRRSIIRTDWPAATTSRTSRGSAAPRAGVYTLECRLGPDRVDQPGQGSFVTVRRNPDGTFGHADLGRPQLPRRPRARSPTFGRGQPGGRDRHRAARAIVAYQATVNIRFPALQRHQRQPRQRHRDLRRQRQSVAMNDIGTDASGTVRAATRQNGILVTQAGVGQPDRRPGDRRQRSHGRRHSSARPRAT